jgi:hypothetical protein
MTALLNALKTLAAQEETLSDEEVVDAIIADCGRDAAGRRDVAPEDQPDARFRAPRDGGAAIV